MPSTGSYSNSRFRVGCHGLLAFFVLIQNASAAGSSIGPNCSPKDVSFARYIASLQERDLFTESGPVATFIQASLPRLYKDAELLAIRETGKNERSVYHVLSTGGDAIAGKEVIARYFELRQQTEDQPESSLLITPANYKFRFRGEMATGDGSSYIYDITPRKNRPGLIKGQIWIDARTGAEVIVTGRLTDKGGTADLVRETTLVNGSPVVRVTHMGFAFPFLGRGELVVTEFPTVIESPAEAPKQASAEEARTSQRLR